MTDYERINSERKNIRSVTMGKRDEIPSQFRQILSDEICKELLQMEWYREADGILSYASAFSEVYTDSFNKRVIEDGKQLFLPRTWPGTGRMEFYPVTDLAQLRYGYKGIREPAGEEPALFENGGYEGRLLMVMPGVVFDGEGNRLGYGGGYYDRYLSRFGAHIRHRLMIAYSIQRVEKIPTCGWDKKPELILTEPDEERLQDYFARMAERREARSEKRKNMELEEIGRRAKEASRHMNCLGVRDKNRGLIAVAEALTGQADRIMEANGADVEAAKEAGMKASLLDRLTLTKERIGDMAEGLRQVANLADPVGEVLSMKTTPQGLQIGKKRVPLGVIGIIYESRPNVTADAFGLCFKTGNAVILRGGRDAIHSNTAIVQVIREALAGCGLCEDAIQLLMDTSHETAERFMRLNQYVDVLIPRGGAGLIRTVVEKSTVPVIETGTGNCHVYVDETADIPMAVNIIENAKTQRLGVCNACESLVIHSAALEKAMPAIGEMLVSHGVEIRGDERARACFEGMKEASEEDYGTEYLDAIISVKTVDSLEEAISHINKYNTGHSEAIVTSDYDSAMKFLNEIDAAAVYVNASTRFTDGFEFGFGAEIGISTQKLHARGPMGLEALTTTKFIILGNGQIRQ